MRRTRRRRVILAILLCIASVIAYGTQVIQERSITSQSVDSSQYEAIDGVSAMGVLETLVVKGKAPKTEYHRTQFGNGWAMYAGCDMRNTILYRDLDLAATDDSCKVTKGTLNDPYTGKVIEFARGEQTSPKVQIDHVVALSNAWQTGAQQLTFLRREQFANDPLNLLAVSGESNQQKGDGDAATWLPQNKAFRCQYVARQIAVKRAYDLWITYAEKNAMIRVLESCPSQTIPLAPQP